MTATHLASPNFDVRAKGAAIDLVILHYTGMRNAAQALARLCDASAKVSAHYLIDAAGGLFHLVDEGDRAWHAGRAYWRGLRDINSHSIGIELVNPGLEFGYCDFTPPQMDRLLGLLTDIASRHTIAPAGYLGHSDVAPDRKEDPGERFDWQLLAAAGFGLWPQTPLPCRPVPALRPGDRGPAVAQLRRDLACFGYSLDAHRDEYDLDLVQVMRALQRHWRPRRCDGIADGECQAILTTLLQHPA